MERVRNGNHDVFSRDCDFSFRACLAGIGAYELVLGCSLDSYLKLLIDYHTRGLVQVRQIGIDLQIVGAHDKVVLLTLNVLLVLISALLRSFTVVLKSDGLIDLVMKNFVLNTAQRNPSLISFVDHCRIFVQSDSTVF